MVALSKRKTLPTFPLDSIGSSTHFPFNPKEDINMGRKIIDKLFDVVVRVEMIVRVHANDKDEAQAWISERFAEGLTVEDTSSEFIPLEMMPKIIQANIKKVKRPRRFKPATVNPTPTPINDITL